MFYKRTGYPEEGELLLCTVNKVQFHSVFCNLDEFENKSGMIHISEVSPGRIRNIRDYVKEGKKVVCMVLKINEDKGHIDLSLRRVNDSQRRKKMDEIKQEQKAEKLIEMLAKELKKDTKKVYKEVSEKILKEYDMIHLAFIDVVENDADLASVGLEKNVAKKLEKIVKDKIKPKEVSISGEFEISTYAQNGLEIIQNTLSAVESDSVSVSYGGGGRYFIKVVAKEYKEAEKILDATKKNVLDSIEKNKGQARFKRFEK